MGPKKKTLNLYLLLGRTPRRTQQKGIATKRSRQSQRLWFYLAPLVAFCSRSLSFTLLPVFAITYSVHSGLSLSYENTSRQSQHADGLQPLAVSSAQFDVDCRRCSGFLRNHHS